MTTHTNPTTERTATPERPSPRRINLSGSRVRFASNPRAALRSSPRLRLTRGVLTR